MSYTISLRYSLSNLKRVGLGVSGRQRAFCDTVHAVRSWAVVLTNPVPMHGCAIVFHRVCHCDIDMVAPCSSNRRTRILAVDEEADPLAVAVRIASAVCDFEVVRDCVAGRWELLVEVGGDAVAVTPAAPTRWAVRALSVCRSSDFKFFLDMDSGGRNNSRP